MLFWRVTIIGLWVTLLGMVGDHPWQLSPGISFVSSVKVPNSESVVYVLLVGDQSRNGRCPSMAVVTWS